MKTLRASYKVDLDYKIVPTHNRGRRGGHNRQLVLLTPDCFKRLCMRSRTRKAEDVRNVLHRAGGAHHAIAGMREEMERMDRMKRPSTASVEPRAGYIYVLRAAHGNMSVFKIGRAKDLPRRLREHAAARLDDAEVLFTYRTEDVVAVETCVKAWLRDKRARKYKEVYEADLEMVKRVIAGCDGVGRLKMTYRAHRSEMTGGYMVAVVHDDGAAPS